MASTEDWTIVKQVTLTGGAVRTTVRLRNGSPHSVTTPADHSTSEDITAAIRAAVAVRMPRPPLA